MSARCRIEFSTSLAPIGSANRLKCGSAGARLVTGAAAAVDVPAGLVVDVVGIGPVGALPRSGGPWRVHAVRGRRDWLSAIGHARRFDAVVPGGHLGAATSPAMLEAVVRLVGPA